MGRPPRGARFARHVARHSHDRGREPSECACTEWDLDTARCGIALSLSSVRTRTHKLTLEGLSGLGGMYDLADDPDEMNNCFDDPAYADVRTELLGMIERHAAISARRFS